MVGIALPWRRVGMNNSVQDLAVRDRRVHGELSEAGVSNVSTVVYDCIITHQVTTRSIARVNQFYVELWVISARRQWNTM